MSLQLHIRRTFCYVGTWAHLDQWDDLPCNAQCIGSELVTLDKEDEEDPCEPQVRQLWFRLWPHTGPVSGFLPMPSDADIKLALESEHTRVGCSHEWDCCGCRSFTAEATRVCGDTHGSLWRVLQSSSLNY